MNINKIKYVIVCLSMLFIGGISFAQNGLEQVIVERYYTSNAADATGSIGALPAGSVTYRVYADMIAGYKFQAMYGVAAHPLTISTTTSFFNNEDRGAITPNTIGSQYLHTNSVALDSWFSTGGAATGQLGVLKTEDNGAANLITSNTMLLNNDGDAGIPLTTQDGIIAGTPQAVNFVGITAAQQAVFGSTSNYGNTFTTSNGSVASLNGSVGPTSTNRVLIGQFTTDGHFHFALNIQVGTGVSGNYQNYVASNPTGTEIMLPSLTFDSYIAPPTVSNVTYCTGATASPLTATAISGDTLRWYTTATGGTGSLTAPTPSTTNAGTTTYYVSQFKGSSLSPRSAITVTVNQTPTVTVNSPSICLGTSTTLTATGASAYSWSQGGTTSTSTVTPLATTTYTVTGTTTGCSASAVSTVTVTVTTTQPGVITGTAAVCTYVGTTTAVNYQITAVAGASTYVWTVPANVIITSGQGTIAINASFQNVPQGGGALGTISVTAVSAAGCASLPRTYAVTATLPATPTTLTGTAAVCAYEGTTTPLTYTSAAVAGATSYLWTVPAGVTILSGQGTTTLTVDYHLVTASGALGSITVAAVSHCGSGVAKVLAITGTVPATPTTLTGTAAVCAYVGTTTPLTYTTTAVAPSYLWTVPAGVTILSGQGTNTITADYHLVTGTGTLGNITVACVSGCGTSAAKALAISRTAPATPGTITGPAAVCSYVGTTTTATYSIVAVAGASSYTWTVPTGVNLLSGQGTNSITVDYQGLTFGAATVGNITVIAHANCGSSLAKSLALTKTAVAVPLSITGQLSDLCLTNTYNYTVPVNALATSYVWTVPTGATINSGQGTTTINVTFPSNYVTGAVTCKNSNACSLSAAKSVTVVAGPPAPGTITGPIVVCSGMQSATPLTYSIAAVTGALSYNWTAPANASIVSGQGTTNVTILFASNFTLGNVSVASVGTCITSAYKTLAVNRAAAEPGLITGSTSICTEVAGSIPVAYSVVAITGATSYVWTLPAGATIVSGAGTNAVSVLFAVNTPTGSFVKVATNSGCINSLFRSSAALTTCASPDAMTGDNQTAGNIFSDIYPNPTTDFINFDVTSDVAKNILVEVYNVLGAEVIAQQYSIAAGVTSIKTNVADLQNGVFMVKLTDLSNYSVVTKTMVK